MDLRRGLIPCNRHTRDKDGVSINSNSHAAMFPLLHMLTISSNTPSILCFLRFLSIDQSTKNNNQASVNCIYVYNNVENENIMDPNPSIVNFRLIMRSITGVVKMVLKNRL